LKIHLNVQTSDMSTDDKALAKLLKCDKRIKRPRHIVKMSGKQNLYDVTVEIDSYYFPKKGLEYSVLRQMFIIPLRRPPARPSEGSNRPATFG